MVGGQIGLYNLPMWRWLWLRERDWLKTRGENISNVYSIPTGFSITRVTLSHVAKESDTKILEGLVVF
jgi:hypothetical protein